MNHVGDKAGYLVYLTISNLPAYVRRSTLKLGYIFITLILVLYEKDPLIYYDIYYKCI